MSSRSSSLKDSSSISLRGLVLISSVVFVVANESIEMMRDFGLILMGLLVAMCVLYNIFDLVNYIKYKMKMN